MMPVSEDLRGSKKRKMRAEFPSFSDLDTSENDVSRRNQIVREQIKE
jgi:hypothetical protein